MICYDGLGTSENILGNSGIHERNGIIRKSSFTVLHLQYIVQRS